MKQCSHDITFQTSGSSLLDVTGPIRRWIMDQDLKAGLLTIFIRHTSASLIIQENADPDVLHDLDVFFRRLFHRGFGCLHAQQTKKCWACQCDRSVAYSVGN